jgi:hypothetical protein
MTGATLIVRKGNQFALCKVRCDGYDLPKAIPHINQHLANTPTLYCQEFLAYHIKDIVPTEAQFDAYNAAVAKYNEEVKNLTPTGDTLEDLMAMQDLQRACGVMDASSGMITWMSLLELTRQGRPFEFELDVPEGLSPWEIYRLAEDKADELMEALGEEFEDYLCSYADYIMLVDLDIPQAYQFNHSVVGDHDDRIETGKNENGTH